jgi:hypothetical protein
MLICKNIDNLTSGRNYKDNPHENSYLFAKIFEVTDVLIHTRTLQVDLILERLKLGTQGFFMLGTLEKN